MPLYPCHIQEFKKKTNDRCIQMKTLVSENLPRKCYLIGGFRVQFELFGPSVIAREAYLDVSSQNSMLM